MNNFYNHQAFIDLNPSQKEAVKNLEGPLLFYQERELGKQECLLPDLQISYIEIRPNLGIYLQ